MPISSSLLAWSRAGCATLISACVLAACGQQSGALKPLKITVEQAEADIEALRTDLLVVKAEGPADVAAIVAALPDPVSVTWDTLSFDEASGATVVGGVKVGLDEAPGMGVAIETIRLWDLDAAFAVARLKGERLAETAPLARRIDASGVSVFGLEAIFDPAMDAYMGAVEDVVSDQIAAASPDPDIADEVLNEFSAGMDVQISKYDFSVGRIVFDDIVLRPYTLTPVQLDAANTFAKIMPFAQGYAAIMRTFAADSIAWFDMTAELGMKQYDEEQAFRIGMDAYGARGLRGGDTDVSVMKDMTFAFDAVVPIYDSEVGYTDENGEYFSYDDEPLEPEMVDFAMSGSFERYSVEGMRLDKLLNHLARGVMPPRTVTDLMSFGVYRSKNERFAFNGTDVYTVAASVMEASDFHWFIPTRLRIGASDVVYNIPGFIDFAMTMDPVNEDAATMEQVRQGLEIAAKYGLDKPSMDFDLVADWNPRTGATSLVLSGGLDDYTRGDLKFTGALPSFDAVSALIPDEPGDADGAAVGKLFGDKSAFAGFEANIVDEGGLTKGFAMAADFIAMAPADDQGVAMFRNAGPDGLRQIAVNGIMLGGSQGEQVMPGVLALATAFADFVAKGGSVKYRSAPAKPLTAESFAAGDSDPVAMFRLLNLSATHTPPKN